MAWHQKGTKALSEPMMTCWLNIHRVLLCHKLPEFVIEVDIGLGNGLAPKRRHAISWTSDDPLMKYSHCFVVLCFVVVILPAPREAWFIYPCFPGWYWIFTLNPDSLGSCCVYAQPMRDALQCNANSHWLGAYMEWSLVVYIYVSYLCQGLFSNEPIFYIFRYVTQFHKILSNITVCIHSALSWRYKPINRREHAKSQ